MICSKNLYDRDGSVNSGVATVNSPATTVIPAAEEATMIPATEKAAAVVPATAVGQETMIEATTETTVVDHDIMEEKLRNG